MRPRSKKAARTRRDHRINQGMLLDVAGHPEMLVRDQLHVGQHGDHARDSENACDDARRGRNDGERHGELDPEISHRRPSSFSQGIVPRGDDFLNGERRADRPGDQHVNHEADCERDDDRAADIAVRIFELRAAVGDGREALVGENGESDAGEKAADRTRSRRFIARRRLEAESGRGQRDDCEDQNAADLHHR